VEDLQDSYEQLQIAIKSVDDPLDVNAFATNEVSQADLQSDIPLKEQVEI